MMWDHSTANSWDLYGRAMELLEGDGCKRNVPDAAALLRCAVFGDRRDVPPPRKTGVGGGGDWIRFWDWIRFCRWCVQKRNKRYNRINLQVQEQHLGSLRQYSSHARAEAL